MAQAGQYSLSEIQQAAPAQPQGQGQYPLSELAPGGGDTPDVTVKLDYDQNAEPSESGILDSLKNLATHVINGSIPIPVGLLKSIYDRGLWQTYLGSAVDPMVDQWHKAKQSAAAGNYLDAFRHTFAALVPSVGPGIANSGDLTVKKFQEGRPGDAIGAALEPALGLFVAPELSDAAVGKLSDLASGTGGIVKSVLNPKAQAAVEWGRQAGIPIDLATATGSKLVGGLQRMQEYTPLGGPIVARAKNAASDALSAVGDQLAGLVSPQDVGPEQAGAALQGSLNQTISGLKQDADAAYGQFRQIANDPKNMRPVQVGTIGSDFDNIVGQEVDDRLQNIRDIAKSGATEMTGKLRREYVNPDDPNDVGDITGRFGGGFKVMFPALRDFSQSPSEIAAAIDRGGSNPLYLRVRNAVRNEVLEEQAPRIQSALADRGLSPDSGTQVPVFKDMATPVDMRSVKAALQPDYDNMKLWMPLAQKNASRGITAMSSIVNGPDFLPASIAEAGLGALKSLAREAESPDLRDVNTAAAARATELLQNEIDKSVSNIGGAEAMNALQNGRAAHAQKMQVADLASQLRDEPVQTFQQATYRNDSGIDLLRQLQSRAPESMPLFGRAWLQQALDKARVGGQFTGGQGFFSALQNLGPETRQILFGNRADAIDHFALLSKNMNTRINPSDSGVVGAMLAQGGYAFAHPVTGVPMIIGNAALAKMLYAPGAAEALTKGLYTPKANVGAARAAATDIMKFAGQYAKPLTAATKAATLNSQNQQ